MFATIVVRSWIDTVVVVVADVEVDMEGQGGQMGVLDHGATERRCLSLRQKTSWADWKCDRP